MVIHFTLNKATMDLNKGVPCQRKSWRKDEDAEFNKLEPIEVSKHMS